MLTALALLLLAQTSPAVRRSTPLSDDPGMVVRQVGTVTTNCLNCGSVSLPDGGLLVTQGPGQDGGAWNVYVAGGNLPVSASISFDGGSIGYLLMPDGGPLEVYVVNQGSSSGGWVPDGGFIGSVSQAINSDGGWGWYVHGDEKIGTPLVAGDDALATQSVIVGLSSGGGGSYVEVKVTPSGALVSEVTQSSIPWLVAGADGGSVQVTGGNWWAGPDGGSLGYVNVSNFDGGVWISSLPPVSVTGSVAVTGPLTDSQLRASPVNVIVTNYDAGVWVASSALPSGASTSALQTTGNTSLSSIDTKTPALGQTTMAGSTPVAIASNQSTLNVIVTNYDAGVFITSMPAITGTVAATQSGTWAVRNQDGSGNALASSTTTPAGTEQALIVRNIPSGTQAVSGTVAATQSGTWNVTNISGTVSLPTGASTSALQSTGNTSLSSIDTKTPALGQTTMAGSTPVTIASNQTAFPVTSDSEFPAAAALADATANPTTTLVGSYLFGYNGTTWDRLRSTIAGGLLVDISDTSLAVTQSGTWNINNISGTISLPTGAATETTLGTRLAESTFTGRFSAGAAAADNFANPTTTGTLGFNMLWDGATWDRAPGNATDGMLVNLGVNNDVTVTSGTVTANAGTGTFTVGQATAANLRTQTASESTNGAALPTTASLIGGTDGTNVQAPRVYDVDTNGAATQYALGSTVVVPNFGGGVSVSGQSDSSGNIALDVYPLVKLVATPTTTAVSCSTTATLAPGSALSNRTTVTLYNASDVTIYIGGSGVTTANGLPLAPGASFTDDVRASPYYCRVASGTADLRVLEN